ncbi:MAG: glycosyltransferase family 4 protein [Terracoccus sp.]
MLVAHPGADLYGSDRMLLESVTGLIETGHKVVVAVPVSGPLVAELEALGARTRVVPMPVLRKSALSPRGMLTLATEAARSLRPSVSLLRQTRPTAVYVSTLTLPSWLLLARLLGSPTVCHVHEADQHRSRFVSKALVLPLLLADRLVVNSRYTSSVLSAAVPRLAHRTTVVYNGVAGPVSVTAPRADVDGPVRLLFVGRLSPRKGPDVAARAVRALEDRGIAAVLDVVGDVFPGYEWFEQALLEEFGDLVASGRVRLRGFAADVWPHIEAADVVLVPATLPESLGNTAIEALLAARPVVVSDAGGLAEVAAGCPTARIVPPGDPDALADAVADLLACWADVRAAAPAEAHEAARRYGPEAYRRAVTAVVDPGRLPVPAPTHR